MILNSRNNLFNFKFPRTFIPEEVAIKYRKYLDRMPGNLVSEPIDYVNYSIQGISIPGINFEPVQQSPNDGTITYHRGSSPIQNTIERQFSIDLQLLDGYINYWIMQDTLLYYYSKGVKEPFINDLKLQVMDSEGIHVMSAVFEKPIMNAISELELNMSSNVAEFTTFTLNFYYNKFNIISEID
jgi:hypothetical protein|tara:strand:+ start:1000 stop:1551 length:552 start_codon:yes stop_codon:yes gene_type:complete